MMHFVLWLYHLFIQFKNCPLPSHLNTNTHKTNISEHTNSAGKKTNKIFFLVHILYPIFHQVLCRRRCHHLIYITTGRLWTVRLQYWSRFVWKTVGGPLMHCSFADHYDWSAVLTHRAIAVALRTNQKSPPLQAWMMMIFGLLRSAWHWPKSS